MSRYFFNILGDEDVHDLDGIEIPDRLTVRFHMVTVATEFVVGRGLPDDREFEMEAIDEDGSIVATMTFGMTTDPK